MQRERADTVSPQDHNLATLLNVNPEQRLLELGQDVPVADLEDYLHAEARHIATRYVQRNGFIAFISRITGWGLVGVRNHYSAIREDVDKVLRGEDIDTRYLENVGAGHLASADAVLRAIGSESLRESSLDTNPAQRVEVVSKSLEDKIIDLDQNGRDYDVQLDKCITHATDNLAIRDRQYAYIYISPRYREDLKREIRNVKNEFAAGTINADSLRQKINLLVNNSLLTVSPTVRYNPEAYKKWWAGELSDDYLRRDYYEYANPAKSKNIIRAVAHSAILIGAAAVNFIPNLIKAPFAMSATAPITLPILSALLVNPRARQMSFIEAQKQEGDVTISGENDGAIFKKTGWVRKLFATAGQKYRGTAEFQLVNARGTFQYFTEVMRQFLDGRVSRTDMTQILAEYKAREMATRDINRNLIHGIGAGGHKLGELRVYYKAMISNGGFDENLITARANEILASGQYADLNKSLINILDRLSRKDAFKASIFAALATYSIIEIKTWIKTGTTNLGYWLGRLTHKTPETASNPFNILGLAKPQAQEVRVISEGDGTYLASGGDKIKAPLLYDGSIDYKNPQVEVFYKNHGIDITTGDYYTLGAEKVEINGRNVDILRGDVVVDPKKPLSIEDIAKLRSQGFEVTNGALLTDYYNVKKIGGVELVIPKGGSFEDLDNGYKVFGADKKDWIFIPKANNNIPNYAAASDAQAFYARNGINIDLSKPTEINHLFDLKNLDHITDEQRRIFAGRGYEFISSKDAWGTKGPWEQGLDAYLVNTKGESIRLEIGHLPHTLAQGESIKIVPKPELVKFFKNSGRMGDSVYDTIQDTYGNSGVKATNIRLFTGINALDGHEHDHMASHIMKVSDIASDVHIDPDTFVITTTNPELLKGTALGIGVETNKGFATVASLCITDQQNPVLGYATTDIPKATFSTSVQTYNFRALSKFVPEFKKIPILNPQTLQIPAPITSIRPWPGTAVGLVPWFTGVYSTKLPLVAVPMVAGNPGRVRQTGSGRGVFTEQRILEINTLLDRNIRDQVATLPADQARIEAQIIDPRISVSNKPDINEYIKNHHTGLNAAQKRKLKSKIEENLRQNKKIYRRKI
jgi:hypothetical protein